MKIPTTGDTFTHGYDGFESRLKQQLYNRGVTKEEHFIKMENLRKLAAEGFRIIRAIDHDCYTVVGKKGTYNPYTDTWTPPQ